MFSLGDIVLVELPFTDGSGSKLRPVAVLKDCTDNDIIVLKITGQDRFGKFDMDITDFKQAGLLKPSVIRVEKIATLDKRIIYTLLGRLSLDDLSTLQKLITNFYKTITDQHL